jgi:hypothetical protein
MQRMFTGNTRFIDFGIEIYTPFCDLLEISQQQSAAILAGNLDVLKVMESHAETGRQEAIKIIRLIYSEENFNQLRDYFTSYVIRPGEEQLSHNKELSKTFNDLCHIKSEKGIGTNFHNALGNFIAAINVAKDNHPQKFFLEQIQNNISSWHHDAAIAYDAIRLAGAVKEVAAELRQESEQALLQQNAAFLEPLKEAGITLRPDGKLDEESKIIVSVSGVIFCQPSYAARVNQQLDSDVRFTLDGGRSPSRVLVKPAEAETLLGADYINRDLGMQLPEAIRGEKRVMAFDCRSCPELFVPMIRLLRNAEQSIIQGIAYQEFEPVFGSKDKAVPLVGKWLLQDEEKDCLIISDHALRGLARPFERSLNSALSQAVVEASGGTVFFVPWQPEKGRGSLTEKFFRIDCSE